MIMCAWRRQVTGDGHFLWCLNAREACSSWVSFAKAADAGKKSRGHRQEGDTAGQHLKHIKEVLQVFFLFVFFVGQQAEVTQLSTVDELLEASFCLA